VKAAEREKLINDLIAENPYIEIWEYLEALKEIEAIEEATQQLHNSKNIHNGKSSNQGSKAVLCYAGTPKVREGIF
jgi:hypothetical protein